MEHYALMVADAGDETCEPVTVHSPYSDEPLATVARADAAQVERALTSAYRLFRDKRGWLGLNQRIAILERLVVVMAERADALAQQAAAEGGKPLVDSRVEVARAIDGVKLCIETIRTEVGQVIPMLEPDPLQSRMAFTQREPIGVVVAVSAFNHPLNLIVHQVCAAVAAGCPVLVKPATATPISCFLFVQMLHECGLPEAWCQAIMPADHQLSTALVTDPRVAFFSFIGSAKVGWSLRAQLAPGTRCALEHGGVAPVIVDASADPDKVIPAILKGGYYHAGQVCVSVQRLFVHDTLFDEIAERLAQGAAVLRVGDPLDPKTEVGPLIQASEIKRVDAWVGEAVDAGAVMPTGGKALGHHCYSPTLLLNPPAKAKVSCQEIFGPVVCQYRFDDPQTAVAAANALPVAFQAALFAQDIDQAVRLYHQLDASAVMINDHTAFRQDAMPFAGLKQSGHGVGGIPHTITEMQIEKMMVIKSGRF